MARRELRDDQWNQIKDLLPGKKGDPGRTSRDNRLFVDSVLWIARTERTGANCRISSAHGTACSSGITGGRKQAYGSAYSERCPTIRTLNT